MRSTQRGHHVMNVVVVVEAAVVVEPAGDRPVVERRPDPQVDRLGACQHLLVTLGPVVVEAGRARLQSRPVEREPHVGDAGLVKFCEVVGPPLDEPVAGRGTDVGGVGESERARRGQCSAAPEWHESSANRSDVRTASPQIGRVDVRRCRRPDEFDDVDRAGESAQFDLAERLGVHALGESLELHRRHQHLDALGVVAQPAAMLTAEPM